MSDPYESFRRAAIRKADKRRWKEWAVPDLRFIRKRRRLIDELRRLNDWAKAKYTGDGYYAALTNDHPEKAKRIAKLYIALGEPVSDRVLDHFGLDEMEVRAEFWGRDLLERMQSGEESIPTYPAEPDDV